MRGASGSWVDLPNDIARDQTTKTIACDRQTFDLLPGTLKLFDFIQNLSWSVRRSTQGGKDGIPLV